MACQSTTTTLSCGHTLSSQTHTCSPAMRPLCKPPTQQRYLHDTCAPCDPEHQRRTARDTYEWAHAKLMCEYRLAKRAGDGDKVRALEEEDARLLRECNEKIRLAGLARQGSDVAWPGKG